MTDAKIIETIQREMSDKKLVIADGHHRYETALAYRDECRSRAGHADRNAPYEKVMMTLFNTAEKGLTILPTHRVVANVAGLSFEGFRAALADAFDWHSYPFAGAAERPGAYEKFRRDLTGRGQEQRAIGVYAGDGAYYLFLLKKGADLEALLPGVSPAQRQLDVVLLHRLILERGLGITADAVKTEKNITYEREMDSGDRGRRPGPRTTLLPAESGKCRNRGGDGHGRRGTAAEVHGLFPKTDERDHDVPAEGLTCRICFSIRYSSKCVFARCYA